MKKAIQDYYPQAVAKCFGCGYANPDGLHHKTWWDGSEGKCEFNPKEKKQALNGYPGVLYGGILASLIECNSVAISIAKTFEIEGLDFDNSLKVVFYTIVKADISYRSAVPIDSKIIAKTKVVNYNRKLVALEVDIFSDGKLCTSAKTVTMRIPPDKLRTLFQIETNMTILN